MSPTFAVRSPKPKNRIVPGPEFVYPCRTWLEYEPRSWEDVANKCHQASQELFRLERSIAFLTSRLPSENDIAIILRALKMSLPALGPSNYLAFDAALRALFEPLALWTAAVIMEPSEASDWHYCIRKSLVQYFTPIMEEIQLYLPQDLASQIREDLLEPAQSDMAVDDARAQLFARFNVRRDALQKRSTPIGARISQQLVAAKMRLFTHKRKSIREGTFASEGGILIFNIQPAGS